MAARKAIAEVRDVDGSWRVDLVKPPTRVIIYYGNSSRPVLGSSPVIVMQWRRSVDVNLEKDAG